MALSEANRKQIERNAKYSKETLIVTILDTLAEMELYPPPKGETNFHRLNKMTLATIYAAIGHHWVCG